jgi:hypothetical protein
MSWHVPADTRAAWVAGHVTAVEGASVEQHLMGCPRCRADLAGTSPPGLDLDRVWAGVVDRVEPPRPSPLARLLRVLGVGEADSLVLGAAPAFTASWVAATAAVVVLTMTASFADPARTLALYLLLAPLVPMAGVAAAYGDGVDPTFELGVASPYSQLRLLLLRTAAVLALAVPLTVLAGAALDPWWVAVAWLAPGLAFVLLVLASTTWFPPLYATSTVALLWATASVVALLTDHPLTLVGSWSALLSALVGAVAAAVLVARRDALSTVPRPGS